MPEIAVATKCVLCGKSFYGPAGALGGDPHPSNIPPRLATFMHKLFMHVNDEHPDRWNFSRARGDELHGWAITSLFESKDDNVLTQRDYFRWKLLQMTLPKLPDTFEEIAKQRAAEFTKAIVNGIETIIARLPDRSRYRWNREQIEGAVRNFIEENLASAFDDALEELFHLITEPDKYTPPQTAEAPQNQPPTLIT